MRKDDFNRLKENNRLFDKSTNVNIGISNKLIIIFFGFALIKVFRMWNRIHPILNSIVLLVGFIIIIYLVRKD